MKQSKTFFLIGNFRICNGIFEGKMLESEMQRIFILNR